MTVTFNLLLLQPIVALIAGVLYRPELALTRQGSCIAEGSRVADVVVWVGGPYNVCVGDPR
jgi:hypothetical protein